VGGVWAIVVTRDRRELLRGCLAALAAQERPPDRVLVVDNAGSDGTPAMVREEFPSVELLQLAVNEGGAGGFHEGMKHAHAGGADWLWLMDDDTVPEPAALAELLAALERLDSPPSFLASRAVWRDGRVHPMNALWPDRTRAALAVQGAERRVMPVRSATFVSLLVDRGAVDRHGLPRKEFFVWSDDIEYTSRIVLAGEGGYLVPASRVLHDTPDPHTAATAEPDRFYLHVRNTTLIALAPARPPRDRLVRLWVLVSTVAAYVRARPTPEALRATARGLRDAVRSAR
jgi:GT2 family glycosyltransferase